MSCLLLEGIRWLCWLRLLGVIGNSHWVASMGSKLMSSSRCLSVTSWEPRQFIINALATLACPRSALLCRLSVCLCFWKMSLYWNTQPQLTLVSVLPQRPNTNTDKHCGVFAEGGPAFSWKAPFPEVEEMDFSSSEVYQALANFGYWQREDVVGGDAAPELRRDVWVAGVGGPKSFSWSYASLAWIWIVCLFWVLGRVDGNYRELGEKLLLWYCSWFAEPSHKLTWTTTLSSHLTSTLCL